MLGEYQLHHKLLQFHHYYNHNRSLDNPQYNLKANHYQVLYIDLYLNNIFYYLYSKIYLLNLDKSDEFQFYKSLKLLHQGNVQQEYIYSNYVLRYYLTITKLLQVGHYNIFYNRNGLQTNLDYPMPKITIYSKYYNYYYLFFCIYINNIRYNLNR